MQKRNEISDTGLILQNVFPSFNNRRYFTKITFLPICLQSIDEIPVSGLECYFFYLCENIKYSGNASDQYMHIAVAP